MWECDECATSCFPTNSESRCLCGHRLRDHPPVPPAPRPGARPPAAGKFTPWACTSGKCACRAFYYIPAEGQWMLRCVCKRKAVEHDPRPPHKSTKPPLNGVVCNGFSSPWVCNCGHPWSRHTQRFVEVRARRGARVKSRPARAALSIRPPRAGSPSLQVELAPMPGGFDDPSVAATIAELESAGDLLDARVRRTDLEAAPIAM